jgi:membrane protease YdiL (CAAX protease family)
VVASAVLQIVYLVTTPRPWNLDAPWLVASSEVLLWGGFIGAVVVASRRHGTRHLSADYGAAVPSPGEVGVGVIGGVVGGMVPIVLGVLAIWATTGFTSTHGTATDIAGIKPEGTAGWIVVILLVVVGAPIIEELFFRGLVQGAFMRRIGTTPAIFVTALIFCAAHTLNEGPIAPMILLAPALVLGYLRVRTQRLAAGMVAHATFNGLTLCLLLIPALR